MTINTHTERFWYFDRIGPRGGTFNRFGPFASKSATAWARERAETLFHYRVGALYSLKERFPSNVPKHFIRPTTKR